MNEAPASVAVGDFNGDGIPDLVLANRGTNNVSVLLGNGDGTFQAALNSAAGTLPTAIAVGDFNTDGNLDVAVVNEGDNTVSILFGIGDGTFQAPVNYAVGSNPTSIAFGYFLSEIPNAPCLAVVNQGDNTVSVLLGKSDGSFFVTHPYPVGSIPVSVALGDFNGDGNVDLVVANNGDATVSVLLGDGHGDFAAALSSSTGLSTSGFPLGSVAVGDFNIDGVLDLAVVNGNKVDGAVNVLLGNGDGTFLPVTSYFIRGTYPTPVSVVAGDLNGDGIHDLAVSNLNGATVSVLLGNGDGTFELPVNYSVSATAISVAEGDLNGDGNLDLVTANQDVSAVSVLLGNGDGTFQAATSYSV